MLADPGQAIEQGGLARIGISDQGDGEGRGGFLIGEHSCKHGGTVEPEPKEYRSADSFANSDSERGGGSDQDIQAGRLSKAQFLSPHTQDAWAARTHHLNERTVAQSEFCQTMRLVRIADDRSDLGALSGSQAAEGDQIMHRVST